MFKAKVAIVAISLLAFGACSDSEDAEAVPANAQENGNNAENPNNNDSPGGGSGVGANPRWVLYDGDGEAVNAIVSSTILGTELGSPEDGDLIDPFETPQCVSVEAFEYLELIRSVAYHLPTGEMAPCYEGYRDVDSPFDDAGFHYADPECQGDRYFTGTIPRYESKTGDLLWGSGEAIEFDEYYRWNETDGEIECRSYSHSSRVLIPVEPVPNEVLDALDNPPYDLRPEF